MNNEIGRALAALLALVTLVAIAEGVVLIRLDERLKTVEDRAAVPTAESGRTPLALVTEFRAFEARQEDEVKAREAVERKLDLLADEIDALGKSVREAPVIAPRDAGTMGSAAAIDEAVSKAVDRKMAELPKPQGGEWKPSLDEFQTAFGLTDDQTARAEQVFDAAKHEAFNLLATKRRDGTAFVDDLVAAFTDTEDPEAKVKQVFMRLFTDKIPGREEAYIVEILRIKQDTDRSLRDILDADQAKKLSRVNLDHLGVKTGYDPFADYAAAVLRGE
jgi:hypothetical protein